jgi:uncharacterized protein HemY
MSAESKKRRQAKRKAEAESLDLTMPGYAALERRLKEATEEVIHEKWQADFDERLNENIKRLEAEDKERRRQRIARRAHKES